MGKNEIARRIINSKLEGSRSVGRPKFGGWMVWWKACGYWGFEDGGHQGQPVWDEGYTGS